MPSSEKPEKTAAKKAEKQSKQSPLDPLKQAYFSVEDKYYELMDYLEDKARVPVYEYFVEPIEKNGIPSFPLAVLVVLLVGLGVFMAATGGFAQTGEVTISLLSGTGEGVDGATVTLYLGDSSYGSVVGQASSKKGKATFSGVPLGKPLYVTVSAAKYKLHEESLGTVTADMPTISISLEEEEAQPDIYRLTLQDESGLPVPVAIVKAKSLAGVQIGAYSTDSKGVAKIQLPSKDSILVTVTKTGYANITDFGLDPNAGLSQTLTLSRPDCANGACEKKVTVVVKVANLQQQPVQAQVRLISSDGGTVLGTASTSGGQAALANVPVGAKGTIIATAAGADAGQYDTYYYYNYAVTSGDNVVSVTMSPSTPGLSPVLVTVTDEAGRPLSAEVNVYSDTSGVFLDRRTTASGVANYSVGNVTTYITAYAKGYLPSVVSGLSPGSVRTVALRQVFAGEVGSMEVQVVDADGSTPVAGASLSIRTSDGRNAGYPKVTTNADGKATFSSVALKADYKVFAEKSPKSGTSGVYRASDTEATKVTVTLNPTSAKVVVTTRSAVNDTGISATVVAYGPRMSNTSCSTGPASNYACELTVRAESPVYLAASSSGYETLTSQQMVLLTGDSKAYPAYLLPSSLRNQFFVKFTGLFDEDGNNVTLVDKGRQYDAKFIINAPTGSSSSVTGFLVRAGTAGKDSLSATDSKEKFAIMAGGTTTSSPEPVFASTYLPSTSCSNDRKSNTELGYFKWVAYSFTGVSGSREITVRILSKPDAAATDRLQISYNGWYSAGGSAADTYLRSPEDADFGSSLRTASRDYCYASSSKVEFSVANGRSTCTSSACISLDFSDGTANYGPSYLGEVNSPLIAKVEVRLLKGVQSPRLFVGSDGATMQVRHYSVTTDAESKEFDSSAKPVPNVTIQLLPFSSPASVSFDLLPVVPVTSGGFVMKFYDGQTELVSARGYVTITGEGKMRIVYVKPDRVNASKYYDLEVKVADANSGSAITDATLSINETFGSPFSGTVPEPITGSSAFDTSQGYNGVYKFNDIYPTANGVFEVIAEQPNYATVRQNVTVNSKDFLSVTPIDLDVCGKYDERSIKIRNGIALNLSVVASSSCAIMTSYVYSQTAYDEMNPATSYYNATSSVAYDPFSQSYKFVLPASALGVFSVRPAAYGKSCSVVFNAEAADRSRATQAVRYTSCASDTNDKFLSVSPSKVVCTSDEGNCDTPATITVSNSLSTDVEGTVRVTLKGTGLALESSGSLAAAGPQTAFALGKSASFEDAEKVSLDSGYTFEMERGASTDLTIVPVSQHKTLQLLVSAVAGPRKASTTVEIKNCPGTIDTVGPKILSTYPTSGATMDYQPFTFLVTTDKPAVCKVNSVYTFPRDDASNNQVHKMTISLNAGTDAAPLAEGQNLYTVACCNLPENGGTCGSSATVISFTFKLKASPTPTPSPSAAAGTYPGQKTCTAIKNLGESCKDEECCANGLECFHLVCQTASKHGYGDRCTQGRSCSSPYICKQASSSTTEVCTCNPDATISGCPSGQYCIDRSTNQPPLNPICSAKSQADTSLGCKQNQNCNAPNYCDATGNCAADPSTQTGTACTLSCETGYQPSSDCKSCVIQTTPPGTAGTSSARLLKYSMSKGELSDSSGTVISSSSGATGGVTYGVSSLFPVTGFFVQVTNDRTDVTGDSPLSVDAGTNAGVYLVKQDGTIDAAVPTTVPNKATLTLFFAYPKPSVASGYYAISAGKDAVTYSGVQDSSVQIGVANFKKVTVTVKAKPIDTSKYTFTAGLFDGKSKMFVPYRYTSDTDPTATLDTAYASPKVVGAAASDFTYRYFNNIMLTANDARRYSPGKDVSITLPNPVTISDSAFTFPDNTITTEVLSGFKGSLQANSAALNVLTAGTGNQALTHTAMANDLTTAVKEASDLASVASSMGDITAAKVFEKLKLSYNAQAAGTANQAAATGKSAPFAGAATTLGYKVGTTCVAFSIGGTCSGVYNLYNSQEPSKCYYLSTCDGIKWSDPSNMYISPDYCATKNQIRLCQKGGSCTLTESCTPTTTQADATQQSGTPASGSTVAASVASGSFPDVYVAAIEGGTLRVLRFAYSADKYEFKGDVTSTFEYPNGEADATITLSESPKTTKIIWAYPGQKFNTAYSAGESPYGAPASPGTGGSSSTSYDYYDLVYGIWLLDSHTFKIGGASYGLYLGHWDNFEGAYVFDYTKKQSKYPVESATRYQLKARDVDDANDVTYEFSPSDNAVFKGCKIIRDNQGVYAGKDCQPLGASDITTMLSGGGSGSSTIPSAGSGDFGVLKEEACTSESNKCVTGSDNYCNPASNKNEHNPRLCCESGLATADGKCVESGPEGGAYSLPGSPGLVQYVLTSGRYAETISDIKSEGQDKYDKISRVQEGSFCSISTYSLLSDPTGCASDSDCLRAFFGITCDKYPCYNVNPPAGDTSVYWTLNKKLELVRYSVGVSSESSTCASKSGSASLGPALMPKLSQVISAPKAAATAQTVGNGVKQSALGKFVGAAGNGVQPFGADKNCVPASATDSCPGSLTCNSPQTGSYSGGPTICSYHRALSLPEATDCDPTRSAWVLVNGVGTCAAYCTSFITGDAAGCASGFVCDKWGSTYPSTAGVCMPTSTSSGSSSAPAGSASQVSSSANSLCQQYNGNLYVHDATGKCTRPGFIDSAASSSSRKICQYAGQIYNPLTGYCTCSMDTERDQQSGVYNGCPFSTYRDASGNLQAGNSALDCVVVWFSLAVLF